MNSWKNSVANSINQLKLASAFNRNNQKKRNIVNLPQLGGQHKSSRPAKNDIKMLKLPLNQLNRKKDQSPLDGPYSSRVHYDSRRGSNKRSV